MKDFLDVAGPLGVTHFVLLTATSKSCNMKVVKIPKVIIQICRASLLGSVLANALILRLPHLEHQAASLPRPNLSHKARTTVLLTLNCGTS